MNPAHPPREVRLRPEFAALYPTIPAGWLPAPQLAEAIVLRAQESRSLGIHRRTFDPRHFEFRGGAGPREPAQRDARTRAGDR
jgi:hypothetical protein